MHKNTLYTHFKTLRDLLLGLSYSLQFGNTRCMVLYFTIDIAGPWYNTESDNEWIPFDTRKIIMVYSISLCAVRFIERNPQGVTTATILYGKMSRENKIFLKKLFWKHIFNQTKTLKTLQASFSTPNHKDERNIYTIQK